MKQVHNYTGSWFLKALLLPLPAMRHFAEFTELVRQQWSKLYADGRQFHSAKEVSDTIPQMAIYSRHVAWLRENVSADRLVFVDIRES